MSNKERHGCVTTWLIIMIIANAVLALVFFLSKNGETEFTSISLPQQIILVMGAISVLNAVFALLLLMWKKWAFYGFMATSLIIFIINISYGIRISQALVGLLGVALLYAVLHIKKNETTTWEKLE